jgi:hypothetical protein
MVNPYHSPRPVDDLPRRPLWVRWSLLGVARRWHATLSVIVSALMGVAIAAAVPSVSLSVNGVPKQPDTTILRLFFILPAAACILQAYVSWLAMRWMDRHSAW